MTTENLNRISEHLEKIEEFIASEPDPVESAKLMLFMNMMYEQRDIALLVIEHKEDIQLKLKQLNECITSIKAKHAIYDKSVTQLRTILSVIVASGAIFSTSIYNYFEHVNSIYTTQIVLMKDIEDIKQRFK